VLKSAPSGGVVACHAVEERRITIAAHATSAFRDT
jgi:hypothetical protein